jgi:hypothetical protein
MNFVKSILLVAGLLSCTITFANPNPASTNSSNAGNSPDPAKFQEHKQAAIARVQAKVQINQQLISCMQAAQDHTAMKACHDTAKQAHDALESQPHQ